MTTVKQSLDKMLEPHWRSIEAKAGSGWGRGWDLLVMACHNAHLARDPNYQIHQIKERLGELRFYSNFHGISHTYELLSVYVCEHCGRGGRLRDDRTRLKTLCNSCSDEVW